MPSIMKLTSVVALLGAAHAAPAVKNTHDEIRRLQEQLDRLTGSMAQETRSRNTGHTDPLVIGNGYLGGPAVSKPDQPGSAAPLPEFFVEGFVTGGKFGVAGFETGADLMTGGFGEGPDKTLPNSLNRFDTVGQETFQDFGNLAQGGTLNPVQQAMNEREKAKLSNNGQQTR